MSDLQILILAVVQGLTEFLPISSSGHLILSPYLFGFADQGLAFDVAVHLGSLIAVLAYLRRDIQRIGIALSWLGSLPRQSPPRTAAWAGRDHRDPARDAGRPGAEIADRERIACTLGNRNDHRSCSACCSAGSTCARGDRGIDEQIVA